MGIQWFAQMLSERGISLTDQQNEQFQLYFKLLVEWNEKMNLTGITEEEAVYEKHFYDSLSLTFFKDFNQIKSIADIGSGAGFPSLPIKIAFPHLKVTIVDSLNKRILFLQHVVEQLGLTDVSCIHGRAEDVARQADHRDKYDLATARAVARLASLNELCLPFVKKGGHFASMKGASPQEEVDESVKSLKELRGKVEAVFNMALPFEQSERHIVMIKKLESTPKKYPRKAGTPIKMPII
ncbi:16S rRNA (guanine(527)-N(7))-methyltransferase RsmG [Paenibacillus pinihumi]|uniref:16S rRNA (guanine(527)-N(7))-methyltransferase RsmG n=1 Tax=Paenibacillus pinihumi TaxID=669462 RepID=UPI00041DA67C|nr:16S rRNA (guanine(527)-N(7))-methyltransferase RsmG [Paenibacillus pinihumi]